MPCAIWSTPPRFAIGAGLAEAADAAVDDARVDLFHVVVRHLEAVLHLRAHVLDEHVGALDELHENGVAFLGFQIELDRALVAVQVLEVGAVAPADDVLAGGSGGSMRITSAPQSARWRTQVGPARASVRSSTTTPVSGRCVLSSFFVHVVCVLNLNSISLLAKLKQD